MENFIGFDEDPIRCDPNLLRGFVYIVKCDKYYKIGYTKRLGSRITQLRVGNPFPIELIHNVEVADAENLEGLLHEAVEKYLYRGEWFILPKKAIQLLVNSMNNYGK